MAITIADSQASRPPGICADYMERLEHLAQNHGWTIEEAMSRALDLTEIALNARYEDPSSRVYLYRDGKRYAVQIED